MNRYEDWLLQHEIKSDEKKVSFTLMILPNLRRCKGCLKRIWWGKTPQACNKVHKELFAPLSKYFGAEKKEKKFTFSLELIKRIDLCYDIFTTAATACSLVGLSHFH